MGLDDGSELAYDRLLIATGSAPRPAPGALAGRDGVHTLRDLDDTLRLRAALTPGARLLVIGAGLIGLEVASTARQLGCEVTVLEAADRPLGRRTPRRSPSGSSTCSAATASAWSSGRGSPRSRARRA